ncbi:8-oxoguanine DNA glycosylase, N-terminal domain [Musa troglodytarum]|uniref:DNA-(apurinic or apyrimidinic site) lyase n=1 Tax=Musa troglodytarum TaxID=320322 RepID=A0A9E7EM00_9LILI|nr:8-oxoguanine DNA glycosylase, N-terminal domain [Musa troglodytarum]
MRPFQALLAPLAAPKPPSPLAGNMRKRRRVKPPSTPLPSSPSLSPPTKRMHGSTAPRFKPQRSLSAPLADAASGEWERLPVSRSELSLSLTLPTGQTFRWRRTDPSRFTGVVGPYLLSLRHVDGDPSGRVAFMLHNSDGCGSATVRAALADYLNLGVSLADLWSRFSGADPRFAELAGQFDGGARVLRQDPVECVFQFLCSSNNNIGRIEKMVGVLSSFGAYLGTVGGFEFHEFPSLERLSLVTEQQLREAGFGYRAKYIVGAVRALQAKPGGGAEWLASLRGLELDKVFDALCTLPGVGPKVAACIALFSLDQHHAIPVDTHVWQIATRYLIPELAGTRLTPKLYRCVSEAFVDKFGEYAGWAQNVLFIGELPSQKVPIQLEVATLSKTESADDEKRELKIAVTNILSDDGSIIR